MPNIYQIRWLGAANKSLKKEPGGGASQKFQRKRKRLSASEHILKGEIKNKYTDTQIQPIL